MNRDLWPEQKAAWAALFQTKTQAQWCELLEGTDACFSPVLDFNEAVSYTHHQARGSFQEINGNLYPAPEPILSRTPAQAGSISPAGHHSHEILAELGFSEAEIQALREKQISN